MDYRKTIKRRLKDLHMTQKQLAEKLGMSENSITSFMTGKAHVSFVNFVKIMDILEMQILFIPNEDLK